MENDKHAGRDAEGHRLFQKDPNGDVWIKVDLCRDGVLAMINRVLFHPRGYALGYDEKSGDFLITGDGREPWRFELGDETSRDLHVAFQMLIGDTAVANGTAIYMLYDPDNPPPGLDADLPVPLSDTETPDES